MGVKLYFSNKLNALVTQMSSDLRALKTPVFMPELIVTQTDGMQSWVSMELAKENSIFANFDFKKPNDIILHVAQLAKVTAHYAMNTEKIKWILYFILEEDEFVSLFPNVSQFYKNSENAEVKRMQLATKIADLFDQMVIYRPAYIKAWNENSRLDTEDETEKWQAFLWVKIRLSFENPMDRTQLKDVLIAQLKSDKELQQALKKNFPTISVFGLSVLTQYHIEFFYEVSKYIDVNFYFLNPAPEQYWFDYKSAKDIQRLKHKFKNLDTDSLLVGNDLLTSWGKIGQDLYAELLSIDEFANASESVLSDEPSRITLLKLIQNEIYNNVPPFEREIIDNELIHDKTLQIVSCHTEAREVEVLYNFLVKTMSDYPDIAPHDILVMIPNIENYSPFIQSIFENAPYKLPFALADRELQQSDELIAVLFSLLELNSFEFTSEKILQLIDYKTITNKYGITNPSLIRKVVNDVNIRFGWGNNETDATETNLVSWQSGIERIVMGIAMHGGEMYDYQGKEILCYDALEGADATEILNFIVFLKAIQGLINDGVQERTLSDWRLYIKQLAEKLLDENSEHDGVTLVLNRLDYIIELEELVSSLIPRNVFMQSINSIFNSNSANTGYLKGNITFCSTLPMRSIPFKVIAFLGMNSNDYPRQETPLGFDLMAKKPKKGDRNSKANDKYLFLEALLSTEKVFYLSYKGRSTKDNSHKEPSILIDELMNYVQQKSMIENVSQILITEHPLHGFSEQYFVEGNANLYSFFNYENTKKPLQLNAGIAENIVENEIQLHTFIAAITNPVKYYFNKVLGIYYNEDSLLVSESEVFELDKLSQAIFKKALLNHDISEDFIVLHKQQGDLPLANMGKVTLLKLEDEILEFKTLFHELIDGFTETTQKGELKIEDLTIGFDLPIYINNTACRQVIVDFSSDFAGKSLAAWLKHLILVAFGQMVETCLVIKDLNKKVAVFKTNFNHKTQALEILKSFESFYISANKKIQILNHKSSYDPWFRQFYKEDHEKLMKGIYSALIADKGVLNYDPYYQSLNSLGGLSEINIASVEVMNTLYQPMMENFLNIEGKK